MILDKYARAEHEHKPKKVEIVIIIAIGVLLIASLSSETIFDIPSYVPIILIIGFIIMKFAHIYHEGGTIMEDYVSLGALIIFIILHIILGGAINAILVTVIIFILLYSTGIMIWVRRSLNSQNGIHVIISYVLAVGMIIFLFAGAYYQNNDLFNNITSNSPLTFEESLYLSAITFTTVGFGDITPLEINRLLASIEALLGTVLNIAFMGYIFASNRNRSPY
ncbi:MAG: potassium channel family protein [Nanoarchaeota archaeon]